MSFWTPERVDQLKALFADDLTAGEIKRELGAESRSAVLGKLHRLGLKRDDSRALRIRRMRQGIASASPRVVRSTPFRKPRALPPQPPTPAPARPAAPSRPCSLLELTNETCRFPIAPEGEPYLACGALEADLIHGVPYCRTCMRIAYQGRSGGSQPLVRTDGTVYAPKI